MKATCYAALALALGTVASCAIAPSVRANDTGSVQAAPIAPPAAPAFNLEIDAFRREGGAMVRLVAHTSAKVDSYRWFSMPPIEDFEPVPGSEHMLFLATRNTGRYRVFLVAAAVVDGKAQTALAYRDFDFTKAEDPSPARITTQRQGRPGPRDIISQAALAVNSPSWAQDRLRLSAAYRAAGSAAEAVQASHGQLPAVWAPFFAAMERLEVGLRAEGILTPGDRERQHLRNTADVLDSLQPPRLR